MKTVAEITAQCADRSLPTPSTLPRIHVQHRRWDLGPNEGIVSQAWRVQVVDTPTGVPTRDGRWLDVQHITAPRDVVTAQVARWMDEPWSDAYAAPPAREPQIAAEQIADPELRAAHEAFHNRYGR